MRELPDQSQRERIRSRLELNLIVEAPAGSGKTHSLSSRMVAGIETGRYRVEEMAAVTFTRKAASELRGRLQLALEEAHAERPSPRFEEALKGLDRSFLGTIHSFCARLVREFPVEAGIPPGFRETDESEDASLRRHVFRRCLEVPEGMRLRRELADSGARPEDLLDALAIVCDNGEADFPASQEERPDVEAAWSAAERLGDALAEVLPPSIDSRTTCQVQTRGRQFVRGCKSDERGLFHLVKLLLLWEREPSFVLKWWPGDRSAQYAMKDRVFALLDPFRTNVVEPFLEHWRAYLYGVSIHFLLEVREHYAKERQRRGLLNFNDLLTVAARLLRENQEAREKLQARYRWLFVDEFQDTDPIQAEVIFYLASEPGQVEPDWTRLRLRPGALFIVGDPKQSIYRFRRADIETYNLVRGRLDDCIPLSASFRSLPGLCEWTNRVFSSLLPSAPTDRQAAFSPLVAVKSGQARLYRSVEACPQYSQAAENEAPRLADWIAESVRSGEFRWGDFLILVLKRDHLAPYLRALEERRIPCEATGGYARGEDFVEAVLELLTTLGDPQDEVSMVGVLRGPLFGLDDDTLFRHKDGEGTFSLAPGPGEPAVIEALACLDAMRDVIRRLPLGAAVERVLEQSGVVAVAAERPGGLADAAELLQLADQIRLLGQEGLTLSESLRTLRMQRADQPLALDCGRSNVVRLMNLHQAKGLEARVVLLASPTGGFPSRADRRIVRTGASAQAFLSIRNQWQTFAQPADWPAHEAEEIGFLEEERTRLLYVAATRAREVLVVSQWSGTHGSAQRPWAPFDSFLAEAEALPSPSAASRSSEPVVAPERPDWSALRETARQPSWNRTSVTAAEAEGGLRVWTAPVPEEVLRSERPDSGTVWGSLIHRLLEHLVRCPAMPSEELERLARWFTFDTPELSELIPLALQTVETVKASEFWQRVMQAGQRLVEVPFGVRVGDRLIFGILDLALQQTDGWDLVDYKTDRKSLEELVARYSGQIGQYAQHWAQLAAEPVRYAGLYSVREAELSANVGSFDPVSEPGNA